MEQRRRLYVLSPLADDLVEDYRKLQAVAEALRPLDGDTFGFHVVLIRDEEDFREHLIRKERFLQHTGGKLPLLYIGVVYIRDQFDVSRLQPIEAQFGLTLLDERELEGP